VATIRERRPGVWEVRVFTGRGDDGRPTQVSRTVRGSKREAQRVASSLESRPTPQAAGRNIADVLAAWQEVNQSVWSEASRRDYASRARLIAKDPIAKVAGARLNVGDVERWHARMRKAGVGEGAIRSRHGVLRSALSQAVRWEWVGDNVASRSRLRQPRRATRGSMSVDEVRSVITAAREIDPAASVALRLAAVAGCRRAELAALRWDDLEDQRLTIDSSVTQRRGAEGDSELLDEPTKTANRRTVHLDPATVAETVALRHQREVVSPYMFSFDAGPAPASRIGWWWSRARAIAGIDPSWRLHDLRHWSATVAISSGTDVRTVAGRLGHANAAMTLRVYAHSVEAADRTLGEQLGVLLDDGARS
jgi:integrase